MQNNEIHEAGYDALAIGIIKQAAKDYRKYLRAEKRHPEEEYVVAHRKELEVFFRSEWYKMLSDVPGKYVIDRIRKEVGFES